MQISCSCNAWVANSASPTSLSTNVVTVQCLNKPSMNTFSRSIPPGFARVHESANISVAATTHVFIAGRGSHSRFSNFLSLGVGFRSPRPKRSASPDELKVKTIKLSNKRQIRAFLLVSGVFDVCFHRTSPKCNDCISIPYPLLSSAAALR